MQETLLAEATEFGNLAQQAAAQGDTESASRLAEAALKRDPSNRRAKSVESTVNPPSAAKPITRGYIGAFHSFVKMDWFKIFGCDVKSAQLGTTRVKAADRSAINCPRMDGH